MLCSLQAQKLHNILRPQAETSFKGGFFLFQASAWDLDNKISNHGLGHSCEGRNPDRY